MRFLVFQHAASEHPGSFRDFMTEDGIVWDTIALDAGDAIPPPEGYDALLVLGGPMDVWEKLSIPGCAQKGVHRDWVSAGTPFLGICLGHQLLADALGGEVGKMPDPEVGVCEGRTDRTRPCLSLLPWLRPLIPHAPVARCGRHRPADGCAGAGGERALRHTGVRGHAPRLRHPVSCGGDRPHRERLGRDPRIQVRAGKHHGEGGQERLEAAVAAHLPRFTAASRTLYGNFLRLVRG